MADDQHDDEQQNDDDGDDTGEQDEQLGEGGKKALEAERRARRDAEAIAKKAKDELERLRAEAMSEQEKALEAARQEAADAAKAEAAAKYRPKLDRQQVRSAASKFARPDDAIRYLDLDDLPRDDEGELDDKALSKALDDVLKDRPELVAREHRRGSADGGPRGGAGGAPDDMNQIIRDRMRH